MTFYRHMGDAGGLGAIAEGGKAGEAGADPKPTDVATGDAGAKAEGGEAGGAGDAKTTGGDASKLTPKQQIEAMTKSHTELQGKYDDLTKKIGKQSEHIGVLKKFTDEFEKNPKVMIEKLAKQKGINLNFGDQSKTPDMTKAIQEGTAEEQSKTLNQMFEAQKAELQNTFNPILNSLVEAQTAAKYPDWDNLAEQRSALTLGMNSGQLTETEIMHFAARGMSVESAVMDAKKAGVAEYLESLNKKKQEQIDARGGGTSGKDGTEGSVTFEDAVKVMAEITG